MPNRRRTPLLGTVPVVAGCLMAFELLTHRQLVFVSDSRTAYLALSTAVVGIALGGWLAARFAQTVGSRAERWAAWALPVALLACVAGFATLGGALPLAVPLLLLPYVAGGVLLAVAFSRFAPATVYALDLSGAAGGAIATALAISSIGEEAAHIVLVAVSLSVPARLVGVRGRRLAGALGVVLAIVAAGNLRLRVYDLARLSDATGLSDWMRPKGALTPAETELMGRTPRKLFEIGADDSQRPRHLHTVSSLAGRIDIVDVDAAHGEPSVTVYENANFIDIMLPYTVDTYVWDPRIPRGVFSGPPDVFVIGTSAEGVLKAARRLGGHVVGAELNHAFVALAQGAARPLCGGCYDDVELVDGEGRSALVADGRRYDMITLMNAHVARGPTMGRAADAEFLHTQQAIASYFDHLEPGGLVNWEEPLYGAMGSRLTVRTLATALAVLRQRGARHPEDHVVAVEWGGAYQQILVRREPWGPAELAALRRWMAEVPRAEVGRTGPLRVPMRPLWLPDERTLDNPLAAWLRTGRIAAAWSPELSRPLRDDRPFPFSIPATRRALARGFGGVGFVSFGAGVALFIALWRRAAGRPGVERAGAALAAGLSGLAFMLVETLWIQQLQLLIGPPVTSFLIVLVAVLLGSGLGAALSPRLSSRVARTALLAVPALLLAQAGLLTVVVEPALSLAPWLRDAVAVGVVGPVSLAMGLPLPVVIRAIRPRLGSGAGALLYGLNGTLGGVGVLGGLVSCSWLGFRASFVVAAGLYLVVAVVVWPSLRRRGTA